MKNELETLLTLLKENKQYLIQDEKGKLHEISHGTAGKIIDVKSAILVSLFGEPRLSADKFELFELLQGTDFAENKKKPRGRGRRKAEA